MPRPWQTMGRIGDEVAVRPVNLGDVPLNSPQHGQCATPYRFMSHIPMKMWSLMPRNSNVVGHHELVRSNNRSRSAKINLLVAISSGRLWVAVSSSSATSVACSTRRSPLSEVHFREGKVLVKMGVHSSQGRAWYSAFNGSRRSSETTHCNTK